MSPPPNSPSTFAPPPSFQQVESSVDGISVYAPVQAAAQPDAEVTFKCPQCGATLAYDVTVGGIACEHCGYSAPTQDERVGRQAQEFEFTLQTWNQAEQGWGVERRELHCASCGASLSLPEGELTVTCPFCASNEVQIGRTPGDVLRPRFLIPFKIQDQQTQNLARAWLGRGWYYPAELSRSAILDRFTGIYLPYWTFDTRITANWRAEVGYERQERYYDHGTKQWHTRTVIDWRWESGRVSLVVDDLLVSGSTHLSRRLLDGLRPFNLNALVAYNPEYLAGWKAQAYDLTLPDAWKSGKDTIREQAKEACYADIPTSHVRNFSMTADFADESWRYILLPVYIAAYKFRENVFQVMVNGQTGQVSGQKPVAWWKIWLAVAAMLLPGLLLLLVGLPLLLLNGLGVFPLFLGLILLIAGGVGAFTLYKNAAASEAA